MDLAASYMQFLADAESGLPWIGWGFLVDGLATWISKATRCYCRLLINQPPTWMVKHLPRGVLFIKSLQCRLDPLDPSQLGPDEL